MTISKVSSARGRLHIEGPEGGQPVIHYEQGGKNGKISCDFVAACNGYHSLGRQSLPIHTFQRFDTEYPFGWLGILAETPPPSDELIYFFHLEGLWVFVSELL